MSQGLHWSLAGQWTLCPLKPDGREGGWEGSPAWVFWLKGKWTCRVRCKNWKVFSQDYYQKGWCTGNALTGVTLVCPPTHISVHHLLCFQLLSWTTFCHLHAYELDPIHHIVFAKRQLYFQNILLFLSCLFQPFPLTEAKVILKKKKKNQIN